MTLISRLPICAAVLLFLATFSVAQDETSTVTNVKTLDCGGVDGFIRKTSGVLVRAKLLKIDATGILVETSKGTEMTYKNSIVKSVRALDGKIQYNPGKDSFDEFVAGLDRDLDEVSVIYEEGPLVVDANNSTHTKPNTIENPVTDNKPMTDTTTKPTTDNTTTENNTTAETNTTDSNTNTNTSIASITKNPFLEVVEPNNTTDNSGSTMTTDSNTTTNTDTGDDSTDTEVRNTEKPAPPKLVVPTAGSVPSRPVATTTATQTAGTAATSTTTTVSGNSAIAWLTQSKFAMGIVVLVVVIFLFNAFR